MDDNHKRKSLLKKLNIAKYFRKKDYALRSPVTDSKFSKSSPNLSKYTLKTISMNSIQSEAIKNLKLNDVIL